MRTFVSLALAGVIGCDADGRDEDPVVEEVVVKGDLEVTSSEELAALDGVTEVTGLLTIRGTEEITLSLPDLRSAGALDLHGNAVLEHLDLPALRAVAGDLHIAYNHQAAAADPEATLHCEALALVDRVEVGGQSVVYGNGGEVADCP